MLGVRVIVRRPINVISGASTRHTALTRGRKPLHTASRVLNASYSTSSSVFARCWVHSSNRTSEILKSVKNGGFKRMYSSQNGADGTGNAGLPLYKRLVHAWKETPTKWYPIPVAVGALLLVAIQYRKKARRAIQEVELNEEGMEVIKLKGPWHVHVIGALPLRNLSRLWGYVNSFELPVWFRPYGFRLYAWIFGCNLNEIEPSDLREYPSLGAFFYRKLQDGARPVDDSVLVSPADGRMLHFGVVEGARVEQVKGMTYSLDALLGLERHSSAQSHTVVPNRGSMEVVDDHEFANVNGIEYSLEQLIGGSEPSTPGTEALSSSSSSGSVTPSTSSSASTLANTSPGSASSSTTVTSPEPSTSEDTHVPMRFGQRTDASVDPTTTKPIQETLVHDASVAVQMGAAGSSVSPTSARHPRPGHALFFAVIYLAPGDYHRFHSATAWVVEKRRHFVGELFSVSPWMAKRLENLFVLNERVALLGRWKYGFFSMVAVGATNVGSIKINFDQDLRTNTSMQRRSIPPPGAYTEATYAAASPLLRGQPLIPGEEMGGFCLGSTVVLVFEAPKDFAFTVQEGEKVRVGQRLGDVPKIEGENVDAD
ncbi:phosphatidylserine decarboxylase 1 [Gymnopilus junonius]|uniref:Phosphatidylserine decarboxylase proenzyme 1, mitochondrial n=1 Tax=Gymnopilus junonius TaxID=109634 RepID=A0A9P5NXF1_GYMJU|nr:phosphatidylserine decarboxylase 1 [Gymnopilus junonius]